MTDLPDTAVIRAVLADGGEFNYRQTVRVLCDEVDRLRADLAVTRQERDRSTERWAEWFHRGTKAESLLARVPQPIVALMESDDVAAILIVDSGVPGVDYHDGSAE